MKHSTNSDVSRYSARLLSSDSHGASTAARPYMDRHLVAPGRKVDDGRHLLGHGSTAGPSVLQRVSRGLDQLMNNFRSRHAERKTIQALSALDDWQLKDIGISRSEILYLARETARCPEQTPSVKLSDIRMERGKPLPAANDPCGNVAA